MRFDIVTIFPAMTESALSAGIIGRAIERGTLNVRVHDLRDFTTDRHRVVDDVPYGGGPGMVLKPEPLFRALDAIEHESDGRPVVLLTSPQGTRLTQEVAQRLSTARHLVVVGDEQSVAEDSFSRGLLDFPQYTRPAEIAGVNGEAATHLKVPDVLLSGNHGEIRRWRKRQALSRTLARRPDLLGQATLDAEEQQILRELKEQDDGRD
jgi:tRNA (guanine37-N1)-methyltransferase